MGGWIDGLTSTGFDGWMNSRANERTKERTEEGWTDRRKNRPTGRQMDRITHAANVAQMNPVGYTFAIIVGKCQQKEITLTT